MQRTRKILILMVDQLSGTLFEQGLAVLFQAPHERRLVVRSARIANCYTITPLCLPAHALFTTGLLPPKFDVKDNFAENFFAAPVATWDASWKFNVRELSPQRLFDRVRGRRRERLDLGDAGCLIDGALDGSVWLLFGHPSLYCGP